MFFVRGQGDIPLHAADQPLLHPRRFGYLIKALPGLGWDSSCLKRASYWDISDDSGLQIMRLWGPKIANFEKLNL